MSSSVGAGDGRVLLSAISAGASGATGYELPDNKGHKLLFDCVKERCDVEGKHHALWEVRSHTCCSTRWCQNPRFFGAQAADFVTFGLLLQAQDIDRMSRIKEGAAVFTFWVGMPVETQQKILSLCARFCSTSPSSPTSPSSLRPQLGSPGALRERF